MSLATGNYTIRSALQDGSYVGRNLLIKDLRIRALPKVPPPPSTLIWETENLGYDRYYLKTIGLPTGVFQDGVYSTPPGTPEKWNVERVPQHGKDQFVIYTNDRELGWLLPYNEPPTPVYAKPLVYSPSLPPQYPPTERWIIEKALYDLD